MRRAADWVGQSGRARKPNFPTVTHPTAGMPQKTAEFRGRCRFVALKMLPFAKTFGIDRLDPDVVA
jgi:hypothetical protein